MVLEVVHAFHNASLIWVFGVRMLGVMAVAWMVSLVAGLVGGVFR
jgi:hypothetical protein